MKLRTVSLQLQVALVYTHDVAVGVCGEKKEIKWPCFGC
jgi:hypothetical protein